MRCESGPLTKIGVTVTVFVRNVDGSRGNGHSIVFVVIRSECGLAGLRAGLVSLNISPEAQLVGLVFNAAVPSVNLAKVVRPYDLAVRALLLPSSHISIVVLNIIFELVIAIIILLSSGN